MGCEIIPLLRVYIYNHMHIAFGAPVEILVTQPQTKSILHNMRRRSFLYDVELRVLAEVHFHSGHFVFRLHLNLYRINILLVYGLWNVIFD